LINSMPKGSLFYFIWWSGTILDKYFLPTVIKFVWKRHSVPLEEIIVITTSGRAFLQMKKQETRTLQDVLEQTLRETGLYEGLEVVRLNNAWDTVIGPAAAKECLSRSFSEGVYKVKIRSGVLRCQLDMQKTVLRARLNTQMGKSIVTDLILY